MQIYCMNIICKQYNIPLLDYFILYSNQNTQTIKPPLIMKLITVYHERHLENRSFKKIVSLN